MKRWNLYRGKMHEKPEGPYILYDDARDRIHELTCALRMLQNHPRGPLTCFEIDRIVDGVLMPEDPKNVWFAIEEERGKS